MRISESQLRRVVKRLVNEAGEVSSGNDLQFWANRLMEEFNKGDPTINIVRNITSGATIGDWSHKDVIDALITAGFAPDEAEKLKTSMFRNPGMNPLDVLKKQPARM